MPVVDASVVVKWYVDEEESAFARDLRDAFINGDVSLSAPTLMPFEVVNALKYSGRFDNAAVEAASASVANYGIELVPFGKIDDVTRLALDADVTSYDAAYVALADARGDTLFTSDERLIEDVREHADCVRHVTHFEG